jgi:hypothetical protein
MAYNKFENVPAMGFSLEEGGGRRWHDADSLWADVRPMLRRVLSSGVVGVQGAHPTVFVFAELMAEFSPADSSFDVDAFLSYYGEQIAQRTDKGARFYRTLEAFTLAAMQSVLDPWGVSFDLSAKSVAERTADAEVLLDIGWDLKKDLPSGSLFG